MQVTAKLRALLNSTSEPSSPAPIIEKFLSGQNADAKALSEELTLLFRDFTHHTPFFISCVYALREKLPTTGDGSIIQEWWDMLLRPAFRDPTLPEEARIQAHAIVSRALDADVTEELVHKFHRRLVDLWVYELPNDVEACGMDETELVKVRCWSNNLCQILLRFGCDKPKVRATHHIDTITHPVCCRNFLTPFARYHPRQIQNNYKNCLWHTSSIQTSQARISLRIIPYLMRSK